MKDVESLLVLSSRRELPESIESGKELALALWPLEEGCWSIATRVEQATVVQLGHLCLTLWQNLIQILLCEAGVKL